MTSTTAEVNQYVTDLFDRSQKLTDLVELQSMLDDLEVVAANVNLVRAQIKGRLSVAAEAAKLGTRVTVKGEPRWVKQTFKPRFDHALVAAKVMSAAQYDEDGERFDDPRPAVERAVKLMGDLYVTASTEPRTQGLNQLQFETRKGAVKTFEPKGWELTDKPPKERE